MSFSKKLFLSFLTSTCLHGALSAQYTESFQAWSATSAATWQTKSLAGAPFNVPAGSVVEIAIRNSNSTTARDGGVRGVGSSLQRRLSLQRGSGGVDVVTMHVQTNGSSQIQHYAENTTDVDFVLLGYWTCGTYVERIDTFNGSAAWTDKELNTYGVQAGNVVEFVLANDAASQQYSAGVRAHGSTVDRRLTLSSPLTGRDHVTMLVVANNSGTATIQTYAEHVNKITFYLVGYWSVAPGNYTQTFADLGGPSANTTWEDIDLTSYGVVDGGIAEIVLANSVTTQANNMGVRPNGSSLSRFLNIRLTGNGAGEWGRMHVQSDAAAVIEYYQQRTTDAHHFYLTGYWDGAVILSDHLLGQVGDDFSENGGETNAELFSFRLAPCAGSLMVTQIVFRLTNLNGLVNGDWAGIELVEDSNLDGHIGVGESTSVGGAGVVNQAAGTITFSTSFTVSQATYYVLRADFATLSFGDQAQISLAASDITATDPVTGSTTSVTHEEVIDCYVETFQAWSATSAGTWQTKDLNAAPFSVPASSVVEIAISNSSGSTERYGGVRAAGSSLERRLQINQANNGGVDVLVMHVQADSSAQVQHYAESTTDVTFTLLGYWKCGEYVEAFNSFTIGSNATWTDADLCSYGVGASHIAEMVMTNSDATNEREAGVRTDGSALQRRLNLHQATGGGVDTATMFVEADSSTGSTIEVYAQDSSDVTFYHVGHWSIAPLAYTELFTDVGSPSSSATWQDIDLTSSGVGNTSHVEFVLANEAPFNERNMGIRENGSALSRFFNIQEATAGGADFSRMQLATDVTATTEFYHANITTENSFYLVGAWDSCASSSSYIVTDLGAISAPNSTLAYGVNNSGKIAGFEEAADGNATAWNADCGTFTGLGDFGGSYAESHDIADDGKVVGWAHNGSNYRHAFTWTSGGGLVDLGTVSGRTQSEALAVNSSGEVVGTVLDFLFASEPTNRLAFLYLPMAAHTLGSGMNSLGTLGGAQSVGADINDSGQVTGGAQNASGNFRPFRWQDGTMTDLGTLGGNSSAVDHRGEAINDEGKVAGRSYTAGGAAHAFYWDGSMVDLGVLSGGDESWALGINDSSIVVGTSDVTGGEFHAFIWDAVNGMRDLNGLLTGGSGWTLTRATDINDSGHIVGWGTNGSGQVRAFMLTPTCKSGAGGAAAVLGTGKGFIDENGSFGGVVYDDRGEPLVQIEVRAAQAGLAVEYELSEPVVVASPNWGGFADDIFFPRILEVSALSPDFALTVIMRFTSDEIAALGVQPQDLMLHVLQSESDPIWASAGTSIGESAPTGVLGDSGLYVNADQSADYWAVVDEGGKFAVGKPRATVEPPIGQPVPRLCGVAMLQPLLTCALVLGVLRRRH